MASIANLDALVAKAQAHLGAGRLAAAEETCHRLLSVLPDHPAGLMILCIVWLRQGNVADAELLLDRGATLYPTVAGFHSTLARVRLQLGKIAQAMEPLEACVLLEVEARDQANDQASNQASNDAREHRLSLAAVYQTRLFASFSPQSKRAMSACLADDALAHSLMNKAWLSLLRLDPEAAPLLKIFASDSYESFAAAMTPALLSDWEANDFLNAGLARFLVADPAIERGLMFTRRWFFQRLYSPNAATTPNAAEVGDFLPLLCTLARYCFHTEYVFEATEDWKGLSAHVTTAARAALLGCYQPLFRCALVHSGAGRLAALSTLSRHPGFQDLIRIQVTEPLAEIALEPTIPALGSIDDDVSRAVRRQYEENPYPRWTSVGAPAAEEAGAAPTGSRPGILIAGCGTGREAVEAALLFPAARVDAIDLSRASLAYGARKAAEMGVDNLFFQQADILDLKRIDKSFDLIMSSGVLHHMKDPQAGLRSLLGVLRPGGILRLGLYSTIARRAISQARDWIARDGFAATPEGIRAFRAAVIARADDDPVKKALVASYDFYSLSQCRDLLFHVQEHTFTLPQIADMARAFELRVLRVDTRSPAHRTAYHARFPHDDEATNLANWHLHEQDNPTTFAGLYSLWLCRSADTDIADMTWVPGNPGDARPV